MSRNSASRLWKYILLCTSPPFTQLPLQDADLIVTGEVRSKTSSIAMKLTLLDDVPDLVEALSSDSVGGHRDCFHPSARHWRDGRGEIASRRHIEQRYEVAQRCHPYRVMVEGVQHWRPCV